MDLLRKYLLTNVYRSPDDSGAAAVVDPATPPADPAVVAAVDPTVDPPAADPPPPEPPPEPAKDDGRKNPWFLKRISDETAAKNAEREARVAAERKAAEAMALVERLQRGDKDVLPPPRVDPQNPQDFQTAVRNEAQRQRLYDDTMDVRNAGVAAFHDFGQTLNLLGHIGALGDDFVADVVAVDKTNAHVILDKLAKDPEKAAALVGMDSRRRTVELTRMAMAAAAPAVDSAAPPAKPAVPAKTVSRAPAPPPPVEPSAKKTVDWRSDEASDAEFDAGFQDMMKKRSARR